MSDAPPYEWSTLYKNLEAQGNVPHASSTTIDAAHAVFQAMYVDLSDVKAALTNSGFDPPLVSVIADVLDVPSGTSWLLQNAVLVVKVRRLQTDRPLGINLDYRTGTTASLVLYCDELAGSVQATAVQTSGPPTVFTITETPPAGGVQVHVQDGAPVLTTLTRAQGVTMTPTAAFEQALLTEFIFASLLYDLHPDIAVSQLAWLKNWSGYNPELVGTFLRSSSLLALLTAEMDAEANGTAFVPYLTRQVYTDLVAAYVAEAKQYEADYRALSTEKTVTDNFIQLAKTLLANKTYETEYTTKLLAQAKANFDNAVAAATAAEQTLRTAQRKAELTAIDFEQVGVPDWEREQIEKAVISLGTAIITFAVGIGAMFVGDPAGGAAAAGGAIEGAKAAEQAAKAGSEVASLAKQLGDVMKELKKVAEALKKVYELSKAIITAVGDMQKASDYAEKMRNLSADTGGADLTSTYQWQVYQQTSDAALKDPIDKGIGYADDLKLAIDAVAVYGQAVAAAQVAAITAGQRYAAVSLQKQLAEQQQAQLQQYVDSLTKGEAPLVALMQQFYQRYLDAKSSLFAAIQGYRASYFYWALEPSTVHPRIIDGVDGLDTGLRNLTSITLDNETALEHFSPPPQLLSDKRFVIDDPAVLQQLADTGEARWVLPLGADAFENFDRVRLSRVRLWLEGAKVGPGQAMNIVMTTQGNYLDRFQKKNYQFTSKPLVRDFAYRVTTRKTGTPDWEFDDGSYGYIEVDGSVDSEVSYAYFQPTPFAEWHISLARTPRVDLSGVTKVTMAFAGSVIAET
jgi:hypothetical protein